MLRHGVGHAGRHVDEIFASFPMFAVDQKALDAKHGFGIVIGL